MRRHIGRTRACAIWGNGPAVAALLCLLALGATAQTVTPAAPALPALPLTVTARWDKPTYAPGDRAALLLNFVNASPPTIALPPITITTAPTISYTDATGTYSVMASVATATVTGATISGTQHIAPITIDIPAVMTPITPPATATYPWTFTRNGDGTWAVTLPGFDLICGGSAARGIGFTATAPAH